MRQRLLELQVEQANRMAVIQQIEYQRRIKELDEARQRELQRQQQLNVEALRREQARVAQIQAGEQARLAESQAEHKSLVHQKPLNTQLTEISDHLRKSSPRSLNKGVSLIGASVKENRLFLSIKLEAINVKTDSYKKVNDELINQISGAVVTTCLDQTLEPLTRQGAVVRYSFFDAKQSFIEGIDTDKTDCVELYGSK
jgi:multidrug efflux pump subunit AcrA (membrane-fusion protein)